MSPAMMSRAGDRVAVPTRPSRQPLRVSAASARPFISHAGYASGAALVAALAQALPAAALENVPVAPPAGVPVPTVAAPPALPSVDVDSTVDQLVAILRAAGQSIKGGVDVLGSGFDVVKEDFKYAEPYLKQTYNTVEPYVQQAVDAAGNVAQQVGTAAGPILKDSVTSVETASGFHISDVVNVVSGAAVTAAAFVAPLVSNVAYVVATNSPVTLAEYGVAAFGLYLASPYLVAFVLGGFRGYAGEVSAVAAVDLLINGNALLIDLRSQKEKEASGVPDLPSSARDRVQEVEFAVTEDRKLRGALRNANAIETQVTALQVSALKRVNKGSTVLLLDRNGNNAVGVAKDLTFKGFRKVYVISGGMDGRNGWLQSKLQVKPSASELTAFAANGTRATRKQLSAPRF